jgi:beta-lactamase class C
MKMRAGVTALAVAGAGIAAWSFGSISASGIPGPAPAQAAVQDVSTVADVPARGSRLIDYRRLDNRLQQVAASDGMVGLAVGVVENGEIRFLKGYGETVELTGEPVTANTVFRWASLSKGVAGDMVAKLADERHLSLEDPVGRYSPSLRLPNGLEQRATVANLLSHTLGLFAHAQDNKLEDGADPAFLRSGLVTLNAICPPGQCHAYQNVAYDAASEVVQKVTGSSYQDAVRDRIFLPLGMTSANMTMLGLTTSPSWARPHLGGKHPKPFEVVDTYYKVPAAGGVNSSIKDLALWMQAQMGVDPAVLSPDTLANVQSPRVQTPGENGRMRKFRERLTHSSYGLGWRIYDYAGHKVVGHRGGVKGYRSLIMFDPVRKTGVAALWNASSNKPSGVEFEVLDMLYKLPAKDWMQLDARAQVAAASTPPA